MRKCPLLRLGQLRRRRGFSSEAISGKKHLAGGQQFLDAPIPSKVRLAGEQHASLGLDDQWMIDYNSIIKLDRAFLFKGAIRC